VLNLGSPRWQELEHAYGSAKDIPALLDQIAQFPEDKVDSGPWFQLWSALAHQGDVYSASFAAVPHVIAALDKSPTKAHESYFHFPAWVEICRARQEVTVPAELQESYFKSLGKLPQLAALAATNAWSLGFLACALSAAAAAKGQHAVAEAILEMAEEGTAEQFLQWHYDQ
jgi:hypothetical protein